MKETKIMDKLFIGIGLVFGLITGYFMGFAIGIHETNEVWEQNMVSEGNAEYIITDPANGTVKFTLIPRTNKIDKIKK